MRKMVYFLLFSIVRTIVVSKFDKKRQSREEIVDKSCSYDETDHTVVTCVRLLNNDEYIIPETIHSNITKFNLFNHTPNSTLITKIDTFNRFSNLIYLNIQGYLKFTDELLELKTKQKLQEQFFRIPTVSVLNVKDCRFLNSSNSELIDISFVLPPNILEFSLVNCDDKHFDWKKIITLKKLIIKNADLKKVPDLGYPSVEELDLSKSPEVFVPAKTLAGFCNLTKYTFTSTIYNTKENYCECTLLLDWFKFLIQINSSVNAESADVNLECFPQVTHIIDCTNYTLDELRTIRNNCLSLKPPVVGSNNVTVESPKAAAPFSFRNIPFWVYTLLIFVIIAAVYTIIMFTAENWMLGGLPKEDKYEEEDYEMEEWIQ